MSENPYKSPLGADIKIFIKPIEGTDKETVAVVFRQGASEAGFYMTAKVANRSDSIPNCIEACREFTDNFDFDTVSYATTQMKNR